MVGKGIVLVSIFLMLCAGLVSAVTPVTDCQELDVLGETYVLSNDIVSDSFYCFRYMDTGITLDGAGYTIFASDGGFSALVVIDSADGVLRNVKFDTNNTSGNQDFVDVDAANVLLENINGTASGGLTAIYAASGTNLTLRQVNMTCTGGAWPIGIDGADGLTIDESVFVSSDGELYFGGATNLLVTNTELNGTLTGVSGAFDSNWYLLPNGTGFSQTCTDATSDGFCDASYDVVGSGVIDATPRAVASIPPPPEAPSCVPGVPCNPLGTGGSVGGGSAPQQQVVVPQAAIGESMQGTTTFSLGAWFAKLWDWIVFWR